MNKLQKIGLVVVGILVLVGLGFYFGHSKVSAQTDTTALPKPTIQNQTFPGGVMLAWKIDKKGVYGFKIERRTVGMNNKKIIAIFNPDPVGYKHITDGGFYTDLNVLKGRTYIYFITTFDRQGNESTPAQLTLLIK